MVCEVEKALEEANEIVEKLMARIRELEAENAALREEAKGKRYTEDELIKVQRLQIERLRKLYHPRIAKLEEALGAVDKRLKAVVDSRKAAGPNYYTTEELMIFINDARALIEAAKGV